MAITLMQRSGQAARINFAQVIILLVAILLAVLFGLAVTVLPWALILGLLVGLLGLLAATFSPFAGVMLVLALAFEIIPNFLQPRLPLFGGRLQLYDMLLILLTVIVVLRLLANKKSIMAALGPMVVPLVYVLICIAISLVYVRFFAPNGSLLSEGRTHIMWLLLPLLALTVETTNRLKWLVLLTCAMGFIIAVYVVLQSLLQIRIMSAARVEMLDSTVNRDIIRSIAGGGVYLIVFTLFLTLNRAYDRRLRWWLAVPIGLILLAGLAVQFGRGVWVATLVGLSVSALLHRGMYGLIRTVISAVFIGGLLLSVASVWQPRLAEAVIDRAAGTFTEVESGGSFGWRRLENREALNQIERRPLTGVGIGGDYKNTVSTRGTFAIETTYIHNAYLYYPLKMGVHATLVPFAFMLGFALVCLQFVKRWGWGADRGLLAAVVGGFAVPVITSWTQPEWAAPQGIAALCLLMTIGLLLSRLGPWTVTGPVKSHFGIGLARSASTQRVC